MKNDYKGKRMLIVVTAALLAAIFPLSLVPAQNAHVSTGKSKYSEIIDSVCSALNEAYVFENLALDMEKYVRQRLADGTYDSISEPAEFFHVFTEDLRSISHDGHIEVMEVAPESMDNTGEEPDAERMLRDLERRRRKNFDFDQVRILPGNVGYLKFDAFHDAKDAGNTAIAAMNFLAYCDALIIDLRDNSGGYPSMVQLISSYFFEDAVHLNSFYYRKEDTTIQFWTQTHVQGPRMVKTHLYIVTSSQCFSGPEEFAYDLKSLGRATIVGERTAGGAHLTQLRSFNNLGMGMWLPFGRSLNPVTGTNWEGTGVEPDIQASADSALDVAYVCALKKLLDTEEDERRRAALTWPLDSIEADRMRYVVDPDDIYLYSGTYGPRRVWVQNGRLYYQREGRSPLILIPMKKDLFRLEALNHMRLQFTRNEEGDVVGLIGLYDDGRCDSNLRTE